jgi:hypothetical protein
MIEGDAMNNVAYQESFGDCAGGGKITYTYSAGLPSSGLVEGVGMDPGSQL